MEREDWSDEEYQDRRRRPMRRSESMSSDSDDYYEAPRRRSESPDRRYSDEDVGETSIRRYEGKGENLDEESDETRMSRLERETYKYIGSHLNPLDRYVERIETRNPHLVDLQKARQEKIKQWKKEDQEREMLRNRLLDEEDEEEAEEMVVKSNENKIVYDEKEFSNKNAHISYLILLGQLAINSGDSGLIATLEKYYNDKYEEGIINIATNLGRSNASIDTILLLTKFYTKPAVMYHFLNIIEVIKLDNNLPSIIPGILNSGMTTAIGWVNNILLDNPYTNRGSGYEIKVLRELMYKHGSPEMRKELDEIYKLVNLPFDARYEIEQYFAIEEEV